MTLSETLLLLLALLLALLVILAGVVWAVSRKWRGPDDTEAVALLRTMNRLYVGLVHGVWRRRQEDPLPPAGGCIVVANHQSGADPCLLAAVTWRWIHYLMAREFYETRGFEWLFRVLGSIPVRRDGNDLGATRAALKALRSGQVVGVFPQGGIREADDPLGVGKAGVALLALRTGVPVVPFYIEGAPTREPVFLALLCPSRARVYHGTPLRAPQRQKPSRDDMERFTAEILRAVAELKDAAQSRKQPVESEAQSS